ncbi:MAG: DsbA family protein [Gammaproteobacteria bacterium]|nr:DsbA family protein [Gammaproteobacteria bacterium]MDH3750774.1 DsbA family protein [Gammaproteobacteria bacterium]MDH3805854.1 DsbA family protein [Gammaproteobacteria bacterium]
MSNKSMNKQVIVLLVVVLAIAVVAATFLTERDDPQSPQDGATARQAALASEHSPTLGDANAKVHIVEFLDPACETCALFFPMVKQWMAEVPGEIRLSVRHVAFHAGSDYAVKVLEASRKQDKYWETLGALLASQRQWTQHHTVLPDQIAPAIASVGLDMDQLMTDMNSIEVMLRMEQDKKDAILLKVSKTPDYFVNGRPLPSFGRQQLADLVREELE